MLLTKAQLRLGRHLLPRTRTPPSFKSRGKGRPREKRYALVFPDAHKPWTKTSGEGLPSVFGTDDLGTKASALFQSALQPGAYCNYGSNTTGFCVFCDENAPP